MKNNQLKKKLQRPKRNALYYEITTDCVIILYHIKFLNQSLYSVLLNKLIKKNVEHEILFVVDFTSKNGDLRGQ